MKAKIVVLKNMTSIGELGLNGVRTLGAGNIKGKESLEIGEGFVQITRNGSTALIPLTEVAYILLEKEEEPKAKK